MKTSQYLNINASLSIICLLIIHPKWEWISPAYRESFWQLLPYTLLVGIALNVIGSLFKAANGD